MGNVASWLAQSVCPREQVIWFAASNGDVEVLRTALTQLTAETREFLEWKDLILSRTPLHVACANGQKICAQLLIEAGANCNSVDHKGNSPLHLASQHGKSEVVKLLLDVQIVNKFAVNCAHLAALDLVRQELRRDDLALNASYQFAQCVETLEDSMCLYSGWLYERADNILSLASGISALNSWRRRFCLVLRTATANVVELDFFSMKSGEKRPPFPESEYFCRTSDGFMCTSDSKWFSRKEHTFSIKVVRKRGGLGIGQFESGEFAAVTKQEFSGWRNFFGTHAVLGNAHAPLANAGSRQDCRDRDLERAIQLSLEESWRIQSSGSPPPTAIPTVAAHAAPESTAPDWNDEEMYSASPPPVVDAHGVEIAQPLHTTLPRPQVVAAADCAATSAPSLQPGESSGNAPAVNECVICFDGELSAVAVPCGHNAVCMDCANEIMSSTRCCPVCRSHVREFIKLYRV